jgi:hypothetical protein
MKRNWVEHHHRFVLPRNIAQWIGGAAEKVGILPIKMYAAII